MNLVTFDELIFLLNKVPYIVELYEKKDPTFSDSVRKWMDDAETILKSNRIQLVAEISTLKAIMISAQRGIQNKNIITTVQTGHNPKRKVMDATAVHVIYESQHLLQMLLNPYEGKYEDAKQLARKILLMASALGILNARLRTTFDPNTLPSLWKELVSNDTISPWTARMLEIVSFDEALTIINKVIDGWINDHAKNLVQ